MKLHKTIISIFIIIFAVIVMAVVFWSGRDEVENKLPGNFQKNTTSSFPANKSPIIPLGISVAQAADGSYHIVPQDLDIRGPQNQDFGDEFEVEVIESETGEPALQFNPKKGTFKPGRYHVEGKIETPEGTRDFSQDFYWGVLALNFNKSIYTPGEEAYIQMAVLDDEGNMVCDAELTLKIQDARNKIQTLSTDDGTIHVNEECRLKRVTQRPDYETSYTVGEPGIYQMTLTAKTPNGTRTIEDWFEVRESVPFDVERVTATRIYPVHEYLVRIKVTPEEDITGTVTEYTPHHFDIRAELTDPQSIERYGEASGSTNFVVQTQDARKVITWNIDWQAGKTYELSYVYDSPDVSPEFYLLGPLEFYTREKSDRTDTIDRTDKSDMFVFREARRWQMAVDAIAFEQTINNCFVTAGNGNTMTSWSPAANEILLLAVVVRKETTAVTNVAGNGLTWTLVADVDDNDGQMGVMVFRASSATTPSAGSITFDHNTARPALAIATRISGGDRTTTDGVEASNSAGGPTPTRDANMKVSVTTVTAGALAVGMGGQRGNDTFDPGADETEEFESAADCGTSGNKLRGNLWYITNPVDPAATVELGQNNSLGAANPWAAVGVSIKPAASNNTPTITSVTDSPDPINPLGTETFSVDWNDADAGENIKVKICKTDSLTSQVCDGGHWASSTAFTTSDPEAPTYTTSGNDAGDNSYFAFVCDDGTACSSSTSGTFTVNATSTITSVVDTPDPTGPGRSVTFYIDWNDASDSVKAKVCKTDSLTGQVCDGGVWASSTAFTTFDPEQLVYDTVAGDKGQTRNYFIFVCDDEALCSSSTSGTFTVNSQSTVPNVKFR